MMKCLLYSQHVLGVGHFFRTMAIADALAPHSVLLVEGGGALDGFSPLPHVRRVALPPLVMDPDFKTVYSPHGESPEQVKTRRAALLMNIVREFQPDVLLTELYPFGRKQFQFELLPVLEEISSKGRRVTTVCSLRDILVEKNDQTAYENRVLKTLNAHYHLLLVHSDPRITALDETFGAVSRIRVPVRYTGFVVRPSPGRGLAPSSGRVIVASSGGGRVGVDLLLATIEAVKRLPSSRLYPRVFLGPFMEEEDRSALKLAASRDTRIQVLPFAKDFPAILAGADLSISMAGYNTCMDILAAGVPALVYPFPQNREQSLRAQRLEKLGAVATIADLTPATLADRIADALDRATPAPPGVAIDLDGARRTREFVEAAHIARDRPRE